MSVEFKVGDRVVVADEYVDDEYMEGHTGTIVRVVNEGCIMIEWDEYLDWGHNCDGLAEDGRGWNSHSDDIKLLEILDWKSQLEELR